MRDIGRFFIGLLFVITSPIWLIILVLAGLCFAIHNIGKDLIG